MKGNLYLIPTTLGEQQPADVIPAKVLGIAAQLRHFVVENTRTARRFLRAIDPEFPIDDSDFVELNEHTDLSTIGQYLDACERGEHVGLMSEAGVPAVADPGNAVVAMAHSKGIRVVPLSGPSSIIRSMMASGLNGQNFAFNGYLPVKQPERIRAIRNYEKRSQTEHQTQLFIEAPYRNMALFEDFMQNLHPETRLCIAADLTLETEFVLTLRIAEWPKHKPDLHKRPAIFAILA